MRIFLDANILFSAAHGDGAVRAFLGILARRGHSLQADAYVVEEARRNLLRKKADAEGDLRRILATVQVAGAPTLLPLPADLASILPEKDWPVLLSAIRLGCDVLVTGDRMHFGRLFGRTVHGVAIHSPRSLAEAVLA